LSLELSMQAIAPVLFKLLRQMDAEAVPNAKGKIPASTSIIMTTLAA